MFIGTLITGHKIRTTKIRQRTKELEEHIKERTAQLETANQELEAFTYSVSHDLRAPLRSMDGFSRVLLEDSSEKLDEHSKDYLRRVMRASQHMNHLIDDLLKLSRLTRSEMHFEKVDLSLLVKSIIKEFQQTNPDRQVEWIRAWNIYVQGDKSLLRIMLRNLIDNAWKYTAKTKRARIEFGVKQNRGRRVFFIKDNGIGFDMKYVDKLFEAFQRQQTEFDGTGIGLTTVRRIVHRHGGQIWAEGKVDKGATFYFTLENIQS
jgi:light-regulated signal transduction histidine kinase (bacteriophytochrome)